jgi:hypothetical protein
MFTTRRAAHRYARQQYERARVHGESERQRLAECVERVEGQLEEIWKLHSPPYQQQLHSDTWYDAGNAWYCPGCRQPWPCATATVIIGRDYEPLKLVPKQDS